MRVPVDKTKAGDKLWRENTGMPAFSRFKPVCLTPYSSHHDQVNFLFDIIEEDIEYFYKLHGPLPPLSPMHMGQ